MAILNICFQSKTKFKFYILYFKFFKNLIMILKNSGKIWEFQARYSKFFEFDEIIRNKIHSSTSSQFLCSPNSINAINLPDFPKKAIFGFSESSKERLEGIEKYLNSLLLNIKFCQNIELSGLLINFLQTQIWKLEEKNFEDNKQRINSINETKCDKNVN